MNLSRMFSITITALAVLLSSGCASSTATKPEMTSDGLQVLDVESIEYVAIHPGANLSSFSKVYIEPVELSFRKHWRPVISGTNLTVSQSQLATLEHELESAFMQSFVEGLKTNSRIEIVAEPAPRVLRITPVLSEVTAVNLAGNAGAAEAVGARKLGHARLALEIHDVRTGTRVVVLNDERNIVEEGRTFLSATRTREKFNEVFSGWGEFVGKGLLNVNPEK